MRAVVAVLAVSLGALAACGDNIHAASDATLDSPTVAPDAQILVDAQADLCSDTVKTIMPGNPGGSASDYPAAGWWSDDTRANGTVAVDTTFGAPIGFGCTSAHFTTGDSTASPSQDKAQLNNFALAGTALSTISTISYYTYRSSLSTGGMEVNLAINVSIAGSSVPSNYATLVYEPYNQSAGVTAIANDTWQQWNATATTTGDGVWWTNKIANPNPGSQAMPQPWAAFQALYPDAAVFGYGFNIGSFNPDMNVAGDGLVFGTTTTDF